MAHIQITVPGERIVEDFTALVKQPTTPATAQPANIGLVEISQSTPTELISGPVGPQGVRGSRWYTGDGAPGTITGQIAGDMYLDDVSGEIWSFNGTIWVNTGTDLSADADQLLAKLITVDGAGSGLDADLLDGQDGAWYQDRVNHTGMQAQSTVTNLVADLALKAPLASPIFTGNPTAPTPTAGDSDTSVATTAFVQNAIATTPAASAEYIASATPDLSLRLTGAAGAASWVFNDKADGTGTERLLVTETGALTLKSTGNAAVFLDKPASGQSSYLMGRMGILNRWQILLGNSTAESGSNAGSDFQIYRSNDDGASAALAMLINRATKQVDFYGEVKTTGSNTAAIYQISTAGAFVGSTTQAVLGVTSGGTGTIYLRPVAYGSATGQTTIDASGNMSVAGGVTSGQFTTFKADDTAASGPYIYLDRDSASPAASDTLGVLYFRGKDSGNAYQEYASIYATILDPTAGSEDGSLIFRKTVAGAITVGMTLSTGGLVVNDGHLYSADTGNFIGIANSVTLGTASGGTGQMLYLRPVAYNSATGQTTIDASGNMSVAGATISVGTTSAAFCTGSTAGAVDIRPNGSASNIGAIRVTTTGLGFFGVTPVARPTLAAATGTIQRTTFVTSSVTLPQLAGVVMAIIADLRGYGLAA